MISTTFKDTLRIAAHHIKDFQRWPLFTELAILPSTRLDTFLWANEVIDWWHADEFDDNVERLRLGRLPPEPDTFDNRHITRGARETAEALWRVRGNHDKTLAVMVLAWDRDQYDGPARGSSRGLYVLEPTVEKLLIEWSDNARVLLGDDGPRYDTKNRRVLPWHEASDPITHEIRLLKSAFTLANAIIHDALLSQTLTRLVHLTRDPAFDLAELNRRREEKRQRDELAEQQRQREYEEQIRNENAAWLEELAKRAERVAMPIDLDHLTSTTGGDPKILQRWMKLGLSIEQMTALVEEGRRGTGRRDVDQMLVRRGLVPGVKNDWTPERAETEVRNNAKGNC